jgi:hypothetical protein
MSSYGFSITLKGSMDQMVKKVTEALKTEGFGVLTEINVKETLKAKINVETRPYMILGACNPQLAHKALTAEPDHGQTGRQARNTGGRQRGANSAGTCTRQPENVISGMAFKNSGLNCSSSDLI